jgi:hypothetical protein
MIVLHVANLFDILLHLTLFLLLLDENWHNMVECQKMEGLEEGIKDGVMAETEKAEAAVIVLLVAA